MTPRGAEPSLLSSGVDRIGGACDPRNVGRGLASKPTVSDRCRPPCRAHVTKGVEAYARYLEGDAAPVFDVSDVAGGSLAASNAGRLAEEPERTISVLLDRAAAGLAVLTACASERSVGELVPWHGLRVPLRSLLASAIGEHLLHGRDLASTIGASWPITRREALLVVENIAPLLPVLLDPDATARLEATIGIRLRGGTMLQLCFDKVTWVVGGDARRFDATVGADPVSFLLVAYGRESQWSNIMRGPTGRVGTATLVGVTAHLVPRPPLASGVSARHPKGQAVGSVVARSWPGTDSTGHGA